LLEELPVWKLGVIMFFPLAGAYALRCWWLRGHVATMLPQERYGLQFRIDLGLFIGLGLLIALFNMLFMDFPLLRSGLKLVLGFTTLGLFQAVDLALDRKRSIIQVAKQLGLGKEPPNNIFPLTRRFLYLTILLAVLISGILTLVIGHDLLWLTANLDQVKSTSQLLRSVILEIIFVAGILLILIVNLTLSYTKNLQLLLDNQTSTLRRMSHGDMNDYVPAVTNDELGFIAGHTNRMLTGLREHLRLIQGMEVAKAIQRNLLPADPPRLPGLDLSGASISCDAVTGDYYDFMGDAPRNRLTVMVGDVSGHGVGSALIMASVRALLRLRLSLPGDLEQCMADVNRFTALDTFGSGRFMTLLCLVINTTSREVHWVNAGHDPGLLYTPEDDAFTELHGTGLPLGVRRESSYSVAKHDPLRPGDIVFLGTDGIWETTNAHNEQFGKTRLRALIREHASGHARDMADAVVHSVRLFRGDHPQQDDLTLTVIKVTA